ncbi:MAG: glycosyltransferase family 4 protein [Fimbriimonas sp.]
MRILMVMQFFDPEPFFKALPFAEALVAQGHEVDVLTGAPNYPFGVLYPGYKTRLFQRESMGKVTVNRVYSYPTHDRSALRRSLGFLSFALTAALLGPWVVKKPDVIYVCHTATTLGIVASIVGFFRKCPFVYDIQDLWPDSITASGMFPYPKLIGLIDKVCRWTYRRANRIVVISKGFKETLIARGVPPAKIDVIYNWCDEAKLQPVPPDEAYARALNLGGEFTVVYTGNLGEVQGLESVLDAAKLVEKRRPDIQFVFAGTGTRADALAERAKDQPNVHFLGRLDYEEMPRLYAIADALLVHLKDDPLFAITVPSKTQAYLHAGRPVIIGVRGNAAELVTEAGAGLACDPEDPEAIADAVLDMASRTPEERTAMGIAGQEFYHREMSFAFGVRRFETIFREMAKSPSEPSLAGSRG